MNFQEFVNWALAQGSVAKYNDGNFIGECVSLINQKAWRVDGVPADAWGHAKDWAKNTAPLHYYKVVNDLQEGDILVYGPEFGGGFGHIEIVLNDTESLFQNRNGNRKVGYGKRLPGYYAVLRLKDEYKKKDEAPKAEENKITMVDEAGLRVLYRLYLGTDISEYGFKNRLGKQTFAQAQQEIIASPTYQKLVAQFTEKQTGAVNHLPQALREAIKLPEQLGVNS